MDAIALGGDAPSDNLLERMEMRAKENEVREWKWMKLVCCAPMDANISSRLIANQAKTLNLNFSAAEHKKIVADMTSAEIWANPKYQVSVFPHTESHKNSWWENDQVTMTHLSIKLRSRKPCHDWRDLWAIKNCLIGERHEAIELYPHVGRLVDGANQYHLYVVDQPDVILPFGFTERLADDSEPKAGEEYRNEDEGILGIKQRPYPKGHSVS